MEWIYLVLIVVGYFLYRAFSSSDSNKKSRTTDERYKRRRTGRGTESSTDRNRESLVDSAKRQESAKNYDEASRLYLQAGQVFSAAKMIALKGPTHAKEAVDIIRINSPDRTEMITRNLANEFFYRRNEPATSAALLRGLGLIEEAEAVEVAAGITPVQTVNQVSTQTSAAVDTRSSTPPVVEQQAEPEIEVEEPEKIEKTPPSVTEEVEKEVPTSGTASHPNTLMMASSKLDKSCSVCKRAIQSGDSFIYCVNCGHPGHWAHLGEMIKVTGKCPVCKERLTQSMYDV